MTAHDLARAVERYLADAGRPLAVYVGPDGTVGYADAAMPPEMMLLQLAGVFTEDASRGQIEAALRTAGMP